MAVYVASTVILGTFAYGPIQVRFAVGMYVLAAKWRGLTVPFALAAGLANYFGGFGFVDVVGGFVVTLATCLVCHAVRRYDALVVATVPLASAPLLATYLHLLFKLPFGLTLLQIGIGQTIAAVTVGYPLLKWAKTR
jgi:uncharacterized membrane protein